MVKGSKIWEAKFDKEAKFERIGWKWHMPWGTQLLIMDGVI